MMSDDVCIRLSAPRVTCSRSCVGDVFTEPGLTLRTESLPCGCDEYSGKRELEAEDRCPARLADEEIPVVGSTGTH